MSYRDEPWDEEPREADLEREEALRDLMEGEKLCERCGCCLVEFEDCRPCEGTGWTLDDDGVGDPENAEACKACDGEGSQPGPCLGSCDPQGEHSQGRAP